MKVDVLIMHRVNTDGTFIQQLFLKEHTHSLFYTAKRHLSVFLDGTREKTLQIFSIAIKKIFQMRDSNDDTAEIGT